MRRYKRRRARIAVLANELRHGKLRHGKLRHGELRRAVGGLLAGCPEAPGQVMEINGKMYKQYRGMGGLAAMKPGSAARYGRDMKSKTDKITAEGMEALRRFLLLSTIR